MVVRIHTQVRAAGGAVGGDELRRDGCSSREARPAWGQRGVWVLVGVLPAGGQGVGSKYDSPKMVSLPADLHGSYEMEMESVKTHHDSLL